MSETDRKNVISPAELTLVEKINILGVRHSEESNQKWTPACDESSDNHSDRVGQADFRLFCPSLCRAELDHLLFLSRGWSKLSRVLDCQKILYLFDDRSVDVPIKNSHHKTATERWKEVEEEHSIAQDGWQRAPPLKSVTNSGIEDRSCSRNKRVNPRCRYQDICYCTIEVHPIWKWIANCPKPLNGNWENWGNRCAVRKVHHHCESKADFESFWLLHGHL
jgi:hypothetical protein